MAEEMIVKELDEVVVRFSRFRWRNATGRKYVLQYFGKPKETISVHFGLSADIRAPQFIDWCLAFQVHVVPEGLYSGR